MGGGYFQREGQEKYCCVGVMKNKNIGGCVLSTQPDQQTKAPMQKCAKKCRKLSNIETFFLARFAHMAFDKIHISGAASHHAQLRWPTLISVAQRFAHCRHSAL